MRMRLEKLEWALTRVSTVGSEVSSDGSGDARPVPNRLRQLDERAATPAVPLDCFTIYR